MCLSVSKKLLLLPGYHKVWMGGNPQHEFIDTVIEASTAISCIVLSFNSDLICLELSV